VFVVSFPNHTLSNPAPRIRRELIQTTSEGEQNYDENIKLYNSHDMHHTFPTCAKITLREIFKT
jgi:hypothetical protein